MGSSAFSALTSKCGVITSANAAPTAKMAAEAPSFTFSDLFQASHNHAMAAIDKLQGSVAKKMSLNSRETEPPTKPPGMARPQAGGINANPVPRSAFCGPVRILNTWKNLSLAHGAKKTLLANIVIEATALQAVSAGSAR